MFGTYISPFVGTKARDFLPAHMHFGMRTSEVDYVVLRQMLHCLLPRHSEAPGMREILAHAVTP